MRNSRRIWIAAVVLGCGGGGGGGTGTTVSVNSVTIAPPNPSVAELQTVQLTATARDASGGAIAGKTFTWSSSAQTIATVNASSGLVSGVAAGTAQISASTDGKTGTVPVTVTPVPSSVQITTPPDSLLSKGATLQLTAVVRNASNAVIAGAPVTWSSSNTAAATVSGTGLVTATADGIAAVSALITATAAPGVTTQYSITARQKLASLLVAPSTANLTTRGSVQLTATPRDARANAIPGLAGGITYASNNTTSATVNSTSGLVTGSGSVGGTATITASLTADGTTVTGTSAITLVPAVVNTSGTSFVPSTPVDIAVGGTVTFNLSSLAHSVIFDAAVAGRPADVPQCTDCSADRAFSTAGTFPFICGVHGASMSGTIRVSP